jgi:shikimate dehydrogenase
VFAEFIEGRLRGPDGHEVAWPELAVLGDPVSHSLSPQLHGAALAERGIDAAYGAIRVAADDLAAALGAAHAAGVRGLNLTLPLKEVALRCVSRATDECARVGAANTLVRRPEGWMAHNTDARGMAMALERELRGGLSAQLSSCVVLGSGGSARAALVALESLGARAVTVAARNLAGAAWAEGFGAKAEDVAEVDAGGFSLIVNCTPLGLDPEDPPPVPPDRIRPDAYVLDLTYAARPSRLLRESAAPGQDGRAMLVAQAALAFSIWYGALPPLDRMAESIGLRWS